MLDVAYQSTLRLARASLWLNKAVELHDRTFGHVSFPKPPEVPRQFIEINTGENRIDNHDKEKVIAYQNQCKQYLQSAMNEYRDAWMEHKQLTYGDLYQSD